MVVDFRTQADPEVIIRTVEVDCVEVVQIPGSAAGRQHTQTLCASPSTSQKAGILQHLQEAAADLLPVCGSERPPIFCRRTQCAWGGIKGDCVEEGGGTVVGTDSLTPTERRTLNRLLS
ncbi:hypothetical protein L3Q82_002877 [Scortum barcoo]|uniref:Uncharacterized protein n=1 Tax=Scortum barcoo TaxID=214431 RepID=A0ACB8VUW4_9TELE|nr:hypothetical protein L3Q82_002877 [Scortum barcoo]